MTAYIGHLSTTSGDGPEVVIKIDGASVCVFTPDERSHVWPAPLIKVTGVSSPRFWITFDDELAVFTAHHPSKFLFEFVPALREAQELASQQGFVPPRRLRPAEQEDAAAPAAKPRPRHTAAAKDEATATTPVEDEGAAGDRQPAGAESPTQPHRRKRHVTPGSTLPPRRRTVRSEPAVPEPHARGVHWQPASDDSEQGHQVLAALADLYHQAFEPSHAEPEPVQPRQAETQPAEPPTVAHAGKPGTRRRWFRRKRGCEHDWQPRTIGGHVGHICVTCFDVTFDIPVEAPPPAPVEAAPPNGDHIVIDLTDQAMAEDLVEAPSRPLLERLAEQNRRDPHH
jgi:hypothetical protein